MKEIPFAKGLSLPVEVITQTTAVIARKGAGKSYAAGKIIEGVAAAKGQFVVIDPVGNFWGLRLAADGKSAGIDVPVLGGLRGDIPLNPDSGKLIADAVVDTARSFVLDVSQFSLGERKRFMTAFGEQLWLRQKALRDPQPILVVLEEAQLFLPQVIQGDDARMVGIWTEIVRLGRNKGIGVMMITQRPQSVSKEALTQTECLIVLQVNGVPEKKALKEWIVEKGLETKLLDELPFLKRGVAYVWSPQWLEHFGKHEILEKWTFDAGMTPKVGVKRVQADLKPIDLEGLKAQMAETVKKGEENDPTALKKKIRELEGALKKAAPGIDPKEVQAQVRAIEHAFKNEMYEMKQQLVEKLNEVSRVVQSWKPDVYRHKYGLSVSAKFVGSTNDEIRGPARFKLPDGVSMKDVKIQAMPIRTQDSYISTGNDGIAKGPKKILIAIAQHPNSMRSTLTTLTGYKASSLNTYLQVLKTSGFIFEDLGFTATEQGLAELGSDYEPLPTGEALREHWLAKLPEGEKRIFRAVMSVYPAPIKREVIDQLTGYKASSRNTYLQKLSSRRLVVTHGQNEVKASEDLFT